ncbi:MAG: KH domain-containing protein [Candidatus Woesearchaeota archaeon]|nr:KH domain-containing protein [Candidatus Woesearchaeota archaeon]
MEEDMEYSYDIKIPKDRVAVLIGKKGEVKKEIEECTKSKIKIDSKEGVHVKAIGSAQRIQPRESPSLIEAGLLP